MSSYSPDATGVSITDFAKMKRDGKPIVMVTAYDSCTARLAAPLVDVLLVGDSVGNVCLGMDNTLPVSMAMMLHHLDAVVRTKPNVPIIVDLPYLSYQIDIKTALENAGKFIQHGASAVKLEGGRKRLELVRRLIDCEIPVMAHLGLTPQSQLVMGGYKVQGKSAEAAKIIMDDAFYLQEAGCFCVLLEGVPSPIATKITEKLDVPTIGIGAGAGCDGQVLVLHDLLGLNEGRKPRFVRQMVDGVGFLRAGLSEWAQAVRERSFPNEAEGYSLPESARAEVADWQLPRG